MMLASKPDSLSTPLFTPEQEKLFTLGKVVLITEATPPSIKQNQLFDTDSPEFLSRSILRHFGIESESSTTFETTMPIWFASYLDSLPDTQAEELMTWLESDPDELISDLTEVIMRCSTNGRPALEK